MRHTARSPCQPIASSGLNGSCAVDSAWRLLITTRQPVAPAGAVPFLNLAALDNAVLRLKQSAAACDTAGAKSLAAGLPLSGAQRAEIESLLQGMEQSLTDPTGLPGRDWFRHLIYAPGLLTGYGVKTLPGVREALEARRWPEAEKYSDLTARALDRYSDRLDRLTAIFTPVAPKN